MKTKTPLAGLALWTILMFTLPSGALAQGDLGLGIRVGDLSGLTLKKYMDGNALEFSIGRTHGFNGRGWYDKRFDGWYREQAFPHSDFDYVGYRASVPVGLQLHYLFRKGINQVADEDVYGLEWYFGFGGQLAFRNYRYDYRYKVPGDPNWYYETGVSVTDMDLGADGVIGMEYTFEDAPISVFLDLTLFMEVVDDPFIFWFQGGLGVRYNF